MHNEVAESTAPIEVLYKSSSDLLDEPTLLNAIHRLITNASGCRIGEQLLKKGNGDVNW